MGERATARNRLSHAAIPPTTNADAHQPPPQQSTNIWSYDKLPPVQIGMDPAALEQNKYANWSSAIAAVQNGGTTTIAITNKPQVSPSVVGPSPKPSVNDSSALIVNSNPVPPTNNNRPFYPHIPGFPGLLQQQKTNPPNQFNPNPTAPNPVGRAVGRPGSQAPIGSHLGNSSSVGVVGPLPNHSPGLQPIGSHLGGSNHFRQNNTYQQHQMQRNFPTNQMHQHFQQQQQQAQQQPTQPRYQLPPYYGVQQQQQNDQNRYSSYNSGGGLIGNPPNLTSPDVDWQHQHSFSQQQPPQQPQQRQQQQQVMNPYVQKELQ